MFAVAHIMVTSAVPCAWFCICDILLEVKFVREWCGRLNASRWSQPGPHGDSGGLRPQPTREALCPAPPTLRARGSLSSVCAGDEEWGLGVALAADPSPWRGELLLGL